MAAPREPRVTTHTRPSDREWRATRVFDAPASRVFDAWTKPDLVRRWLLGPPGWSMPVCEVDLRPGGAWRFAWRSGAGEEMGMGGTYREVARPNRLVSTERWGPEWPETVNTLEFAESGGTTTMTLTVAYPSRAERDRAQVPGMQEGLDEGFRRLDALLAEGA